MTADTQRVEEGASHAAAVTLRKINGHSLAQLHLVCMPAASHSAENKIALAAASRTCLIVLNHLGGRAVLRESATQAISPSAVCSAYPT